MKFDPPAWRHVIVGIPYYGTRVVEERRHQQVHVIK